MSTKRSKKELVNNPLSPPKKAKTGSRAAAGGPRIAPNGYKLPDPIPFGEVVTDSTKNQWTIGTSIGCGGFGEIYAAKRADDRSETWNYVIKVDHYHGPLFAEMNFYHRVAKEESIRNWMRDKRLDFLGMPRFIATGIHERSKTGKKLPSKTSTTKPDPSTILKYRFLVMQRFGDDLQKKLNQVEHKFDLKTSYTIARKVIDILEYIHSFGYIHADTKASNLLLGRSVAPSPRGKGLAEQQGFHSEVWLVDFGLVEKYKDSEGNHKSCEEDMRRANNGTVEFTSRDAHIGALSRRSDLEILAFNILSWLSGGRLPWMSNLKDHKYVHSCKKYYMDRLHDLFNYAFANLKKQPPPSPPPKEVFDAPEPVLKESERKKEREFKVGANGSQVFDKSKLVVQVPPGLQELFQYIIKLDFQQDPDYELLKTILQRAIVKSGYTFDGRFSFNPNQSKGLKSSSALAGAKGGPKARKGLESDFMDTEDDEEVIHVNGGRNGSKSRKRNGTVDVVEKVTSKLKKSVLTSPVQEQEVKKGRGRPKVVKVSSTEEDEEEEATNGHHHPSRGQLKITDFFNRSPSPVNRHTSRLRHPSSTAGDKRGGISSTDGTESDGEDLVSDIVDRVARGAGKPGFKSPAKTKSPSPTNSPAKHGTLNGHRSRIDSPSSPAPRRHLTIGRGQERSKSVSPARKRATSVSAPTSITPNKKMNGANIGTNAANGTSNNGNQGSPVTKSPFNNPTPAMLELLAKLKEKRKLQENGIKAKSLVSKALGKAKSPVRLFTTSAATNKKKPVAAVPIINGAVRGKPGRPKKSRSPVKEIEKEEVVEEEEVESENEDEEEEEEEEEVVIRKPSKKAPRSRSKVLATSPRMVPKSALSSTSSTHSTKENKKVPRPGTRRSPRAR